MIGQNSLNNFYQSVKFSYPRLAALISDDVITVALYGLAADKTPAQEAVDRLRLQTRDLPVALQRVLENALVDLGYL